LEVRRKDVKVKVDKDWGKTPRQPHQTPRSEWRVHAWWWWAETKVVSRRSSSRNR
jgi:hypothetical protein